MSILIQKAGILSTFQDLGRFGYRRLGINPGGVMDRRAARLINILVGNDQSEAVVEMHFPAAEIVFESACIFALGGADLSPELDRDEIGNWSACIAKSGSVLRFTTKILGNRAYLAVQGGFAIDKWLDSSSTNLTAGIGGLEGRKLLNGDRLEFNVQAKPKRPNLNPRISPSLLPGYSNFPTVRVIAGAEFGKLDNGSKLSLETQNFTVSNNSNRMGFRLNGEPLSLVTPLEMVSSAVTFGTIQLLPDGQLIVLMADHQTTGGYPRIAHVIDCDLSVMAQLGGGDRVAFQIVSLDLAEALNAKLEQDIAVLRVGCQKSIKI